MNVVVVESPAKAKTINKYLGKEFIVLASYGHVRDLPSKNGSVEPDDNFAMKYVIDSSSQKHVKAIAQALKTADKLYLATDPDREGEAIAWHILNALKENGTFQNKEVKRIVFNEITKGAVQAALKSPRDIDMDLVYAQQARRALDYLVGFNLSPVLWRKLPGARSAGRVQSVALRLICERELEIKKFKPEEYWSIEVIFLNSKKEKIVSRLVSLNNEKLEKFSLRNKSEADSAINTINSSNSFSVSSIVSKKSNRYPQPPFTTSTLQQEASRKLRLSAKRTMQIAQKLYEGIELDGETTGLITYMRTDGVQISSEAIGVGRNVINKEFGKNYLPTEPRAYKSKAKNAQEAHEAIRPTDLSRLPKMISKHLDRDQMNLYDLIWKRTISSQMSNAEIESTSLNISSSDKASTFRSSGQVILFDGFLKVYQEGLDDKDNNQNQVKILPKVYKDEIMDKDNVSSKQHFTDPPPRYTEATLVKKLEELGIGRPSTYASILSVLQERDYVNLEKNRFFAEDRGQLVTAFLESFFQQYVEYDFTANLESKLDEISAGNAVWTEVLSEFWNNFNSAIDKTKELRIRDVLDSLNEILADHIFESDSKNRHSRACPSCENGELSLKVGKFGAFVGCSNYPDCKFTRQISTVDSSESALDSGPRELGIDPESGETITIRKGPYGFYIQRGELIEDKKPKRVGLPPNENPLVIDLDRSLKFLTLPREVGKHPETGKKISGAIGRFGPFIRHDGEYRSIGKDEDVLTIGLNRAVVLLAEPKKRRGPEVLKKLGEHPTESGSVNVLDGKYGPYVNHGKINATIPSDIEPLEIDLDEALELLKQRALKSKKTNKKATKKKATKKKATKKKATKKKAK